MIKDKTQEWKALHGRHVRMFYFINQVEGTAPYMAAEPDKQLILHCENMGDRMETWICQVEPEGREIVRYNVKGVESIIWAEAT